jgi:hypothetical protein
MAKQGDVSLIQKGNMSRQQGDSAEGSAEAPPSKRFVTVCVGEFAREAIAGEEGMSSERIPLHAVQAIRCYMNDRALGRPGWKYPVALREDWEAAKKVELELSIDRDLWLSLEDEADRQGVSSQQLVEHAAFYFAAEVNAGRATRRILDELEQPPD